MIKLLAYFGILMVGIQSANAACTKPVGRYVGSGGGVEYNVLTSSVANAGTLQLSISIPISGQWKANYWALAGQGKTSGNFTIPSTGANGNSFNMTLCRGQTTTSNNLTFSYVVSESGNRIELMFYKVDGVVSAYIITLLKT